MLSAFFPGGHTVADPNSEIWSTGLGGKECGAGHVWALHSRGGRERHSPGGRLGKAGFPIYFSMAVLLSTLEFLSYPCPPHGF